MGRWPKYWNKICLCLCPDEITFIQQKQDVYVINIYACLFMF